MEKLNNFEHLVYGDKGLVLTKYNLSNKNLVSPLDVAKFLITLNEIDYSIKNANELFSLSAEDFVSFSDELIDFLSDFDVDSFMFRNSFANTLELSDYTQEEWIAIFAQYTITYGNKDFFESHFGNAESILENYFSKNIKENFSIKTNSKQIVVSFDYYEDANALLVNILESKIALREHQIKILESVELDMLKQARENSKIAIKDIEVSFLKRFINSDDILDHTLFRDLDVILRVVVNLYSFDKEEYRVNKRIVPFTNELNEQLNSTMLKKLAIKLPTKMKKAITKALNDRFDVDNTVENMFKYYGFWKKILSACKFQSDEKNNEKYPNFVAIKTKLYENDRSNTINAKVESAKFRGDYLSAARELSNNPGMFLRNLLEYVRYENGDRKARKTKNSSKSNSNFSNGNINISSILGADNKNRTGVYSNEKFKENFSRTVKSDAFDFFKNGDFASMLSGSNGSVNTKLLWHALSQFDDEKIYTDRSERYINATKSYVHYEDAIPGIDKDRAEVVKSELLDSIKTIKKSENSKLGKVYIQEALKDFNIEFSGRASNGINLSGKRLTPGSKIDLKDLLGEEKILRMGIAWRGNGSCDIDHSLNLFKHNGGTANQDFVYYGKPVLKKGNDVVISSSGDITFCESNLFSTELIDIDIDKAFEYDIGNMVSSAIQFSGKTFDNYEILWFFNIIDKKDRIIDGQQIKLSLDQMDYAIQINEKTKAMLGFHIDLKNGFLEVLNIAFNEHDFQLRSNAATNRASFEKILKHRPPMLALDRVLKDTISESQIVSCIEDADVAFVSSDKSVGEEIKAKIVNVSTNAEELQSIIF